MKTLAFVVAAVLAGPLFAMTALPTIIAVESNDSTEAIPLFKDVATSAVSVAPVVVSGPAHGSISLAPAKSTYWKLQRPAVPSFKQIPITWFNYKPETGFTGTDSFTYYVTDGNGASSNTVSCIVKVRPRTPAGQTVLFLVHDTLSVSLSTEINRLKTDMESDGYSVIVKSYRPASRTSLFTDNNVSALAAWNSLREEYLAPGRMMTGAILFGYVPPIRASIASDDGFWNMSLPLNEWQRDSMFFHLGSSAGPNDSAGRNDTNYTGYTVDIYPRGGSLRHIWVSRFYGLSNSGRASSLYGGEAELLRRALDNNHHYRTGASRYPHRAYHYSMSKLSFLSMTRFCPIWQDTLQLPNSKTSGFTVLPSGDTMHHTLTPYTAGHGGEVWDIYCHGNTSFLNPTNGYFYMRTDTLMKRPFQTRFVFLSSCHTSYPGNLTNNHLFTRGGGTVLAMGTSDYVHFNAWFSIANEQPPSVKLAAMLAAGSNWGNAWLASDMPLAYCYFYGDLSLKPKPHPSNAFPIITSFEQTDAGPGRVRISVEAGDPDGEITAYEWWFRTPYNDGMNDPDTVTTASFIEVDASRVSAAFPVRLEVVDNYMARYYADLGSGNVGSEAGRSESGRSDNSAVLHALPNPFNPSVTIRLSLPSGSTAPVRLTIYTIDGALVASHTLEPGTHGNGFVWDAGSRPAGVYLVKTAAAGVSLRKRIFLVR